MRTGNILGFVVGGLLTAIVLVLVSVWLFVDPNHYKDKIIAAVKDATGRELILQGDIKLSVFPWIALELGPASLGNPAGFGAQPFVSLQRAAVRVKIFPLLRQRLEIARVEIDGLDVRLAKNATGKGNWEGFGESDAETTDARSKNGGIPAGIPFIPAIKVTHARVTYDQFTLDNVSFETTPFADGVLPISIHVDANRGIATEHAFVDTRLDFSTRGARRYRLAAFTLVGQVFQAGDVRPLRWNMSMAALDVDLTGQTLSAPNIELNVAGAQFSGSVSGSKLIDDLSLSGALALAPLVLREFIPRWGVTPPQTKDPRALSQLSGSTAFSYADHALHLDKLQCVLDDTHIQGSFAVENLPMRALRFNLSVDHVDMNRYLAPEGQPPVQSAPVAHTTAPTAPLDAQGTLTVGSLQLSRLDLSDLKMTLAAKDGLSRVFPLLAQIDGGRYSGDVTLDARADIPVVSIDEHLTGIDVGRLFAPTGKGVHLSGKGTVNLQATGRGEGAAAMRRALNGHADAYITEGAVEGIDLGYQLGRAEALIQRESVPSGEDTNRTQFDAFKMSAQIVNGVAETKDLTISSPVLRITGQGSADLVSKGIDFRLLADTLRTTRGVPIQIPVKITGTTVDPIIRPDIEALARGQLRQKLQDVLHDKLKGLFGKP